MCELYLCPFQYIVICIMFVMSLDIKSYLKVMININSVKLR